MKRKIVALFMTCTLGATLLTGCGDIASAFSSDDKEEDVDEDVDDESDKKDKDKDEESGDSEKASDESEDDQKIKIALM
jgi:hypothetical protein